jgi:hypothetical protein
MLVEECSLPLCVVTQSEGFLSKTTQLVVQFLRESERVHSILPWIYCCFAEPEWKGTRCFAEPEWKGTLYGYSLRFCTSRVEGFTRRIQSEQKTQSGMLHSTATDPVASRAPNKRRRQAMLVKTILWFQTKVLYTYFYVLFVRQSDIEVFSLSITDTFVLEWEPTLWGELPM